MKNHENWGLNGMRSHWEWDVSYWGMGFTFMPFFSFGAGRNRSENPLPFHAPIGSERWVFIWVCYGRGAFVQFSNRSQFSSQSQNKWQRNSLYWKVVCVSRFDKHFAWSEDTITSWSVTKKVPGSRFSFLKIAVDRSAHSSSYFCFPPLMQRFSTVQFKHPIEQRATISSHKEGRASLRHKHTVLWHRTIW